MAVPSGELFSTLVSGQIEIEFRPSSLVTFFWATRRKLPGSRAGTRRGLPSRGLSNISDYFAPAAPDFVPQVPQAVAQIGATFDAASLSALPWAITSC
jgi:hypothetical protein